MKRAQMYSIVRLQLHRLPCRLWPRRRWGAVAGGLMALMLCGLSWPLMQRALTENRSLLQQLSAEWSLMRTMRAELQQLQGTPLLKPESGLELEQRFRHLAAQQGFSLSGWRIDPGPHQLVLSGVADFDHWLQFAAALELRAQLVLAQLTVEAGSQAGRVQIDAVLQRGVPEK